MCGICGIVHFDGHPADRADIERMMLKMKHRGPDDEGVYLDKNVGLGFVRLSILDLSPAGNQPMQSKSGRYVILFNGEIFNYLEIKQSLSAKYSFLSGSDTEVILAAYQEWGRECVERFNGMWAFVIYDKYTGTLFVSRDRFGIKPFYYYTDGRIFVFASDIPPILEVLGSKPAPDDQLIYDFLAFSRTNHTSGTFFKGIKKLRHAHNMTIEGKSINLYKWYDLRGKRDEGFADEDQFRDSLILSIRQQLRSDVPVGACLSGGLDSSTIVSLAMKYFSPPEIDAFSAVYEKGMHCDESEFIDEYKDLVKNIHFAKPTAYSLHDQLDEYVQAMVEPVPNTSEFAEFKVMEIAKKHCKVVLNGQGADEEMAGYLVFFGYYFKELLTGFKWIKLIDEIRSYKKIHPSNAGLKSFAFFLLPAKLKSRGNFLKKDSIARDFARQFTASPELSDGLYGSNTLTQALLNHFEFKLEHHLIWADRSGMWFSVETRFPFLDHRFVEKILSTPSDKILENGVTKRILRESMKGILPEKIRTRMDKIGYETPEADWFRQPIFRDFISHLITSESFRGRKYFDLEKVSGLYRKHLDGTIDVSQDIWKWINLELWFRKFID